MKLSLHLINTTSETKKFLLSLGIAPATIDNVDQAVVEFSSEELEALKTGATDTLNTVVGDTLSVNTKTNDLAEEVKTIK